MIICNETEFRDKWLHTLQQSMDNDEIEELISDIHDWISNEKRQIE